MTFIRVLVAAISVAAISLPTAAAAQGSQAFRHENTPQNLQALFELMFRKIHVEKSLKEAAALFKSLMPDEARLKPALRNGVSRQFLQQIAEMHGAVLKAPDDQIGGLASRTQTVVQVSGATSEELRRKASAASEFPGGAIQVANLILRAGVTFYEVEFLEPGSNAGMVYHLLYWNGRTWSMLGPVWRLLP